MNKRIVDLQEKGCDLHRLGDPPRRTHIGLVSDTETCPGAVLFLDGRALDADDLRALLDIVHCVLQMKSFAALSDESAEKFSGKQLLVAGSPGIVVGPSGHEGHWLFRKTCDPRTYDTHNVGAYFTPLTPPKDPEPEYSPYTAPNQATWLIGKELDNGNTVKYVGADGVVLKDCIVSFMSYSTLVERMCDGKRCGTCKN